jgi:hypothetical protein
MPPTAHSNRFQLYIDIINFKRGIIFNKKWKIMCYGILERYGRFVSLFMKYGMDVLAGKLNAK